MNSSRLTVKKNLPDRRGANQRGEVVVGNLTDTAVGRAVDAAAG